MKIKEIVLTVFKNTLIGYLLMLFIDHITKIASSFNNVILRAGLTIFGATLFISIFGKVMNDSKFKLSHPINVIGLTFKVVGVTFAYYML